MKLVSARLVFSLVVVYACEILSDSAERKPRKASPLHQRLEHVRNDS